jgi:hypothetical protein
MSKIIKLNKEEIKEEIKISNETRTSNMVLKIYKLIQSGGATLVIGGDEEPLKKYEIYTSMSNKCFLLIKLNRLNDFINIAENNTMGNYLRGIGNVNPCGIDSILFEDSILVRINDVFCSANIDLKEIEW